MEKWEICFRTAYLHQTYISSTCSSLLLIWCFKVPLRPAIAVTQGYHFLSQRKFFLFFPAEYSENVKDRRYIYSSYNSVSWYILFFDIHFQKECHFIVKIIFNVENLHNTICILNIHYLRKISRYECFMFIYPWNKNIFCNTIGHISSISWLNEYETSIITYP